jgi:hypothetical protein
MLLYTAHGYDMTILGHNRETTMHSLLIWNGARFYSSGNIEVEMYKKMELTLRPRHSNGEVDIIRALNR